MHLLCCTYNHYSTKEGCQTTGMSNDWGAGRLGQPHRALRPVKRPPQHRGTRNAARPATHRGPLRLHRLRTAPCARRAPRAPCARDSHAPVRSGPLQLHHAAEQARLRAARGRPAHPARATAPSFSTTTLSAPITVRILWLITSTVFPASSRARARCDLAVSFSTSRLAVASSRSTTGASFRSARAMEMRCRSPPERRAPFSPMRVRYPSGRAQTNSSQLAARAAANTSSSVASARPRRMFSITVSSNSTTSWNTSA